MFHRLSRHLLLCAALRTKASSSLTTCLIKKRFLTPYNIRENCQNIFLGNEKFCYKINERLLCVFLPVETINIVIFINFRARVEISRIYL